MTSPSVTSEVDGVSLWVDEPAFSPLPLAPITPMTTRIRHGGVGSESTSKTLHFDLDEESKPEKPNQRRFSVKTAIRIIAVGIGLYAVAALVGILTRPSPTVGVRATCAIPSPERAQFLDASSYSRSNMKVVSHKCSLSPQSPHPLGMWPACAQLVRSGVSALDVDVFLSTDDLMFVGHPKDESERLRVPSVQDLRSDSLIAGGVLRLEDFLSGVDGLGEDIVSVNMEPKQRLLTSRALLMNLLEVVQRYPSARARVVLIVDDVSIATAIKRRYPSQALAAAVKDQGRQDMPNEHQLCNPEVPLSTRLATITRLYSILLPSVKALDLPGCSEAMAPLAAAGVRIQVWVVDDLETVSILNQPDMSYVSGIITNAPFAVAPHCFV